MGNYLNTEKITDLIAAGVGVIEPKRKADEPPDTGFSTATDLLNRDIEEIPCLIEPILPRTGIAAIAGASDTGKSALLRQMAIDVCTGNSFLNFPINARYMRAIYVSTEDDETAVSYLLNKQNKELLLHPDELNNLIFIFDTENLVSNLEKLLSEKPADLVVIDCFTDIYGKSMNQANEVRTFLNQFSQLANKYQCLIMFLHHTGKNRENDLPSKNNLLGSQAFEAKMRAVFELRNDLADDEKKHLCIVKGNYLSAEFKKESYVLDFSENLVFRNTGDRCMFDMLVKNDDVKKERYEKIIEMKNSGYSYAQIAIELGYKNKSSISRLVKEIEENVNVAKSLHNATETTTQATKDDEGNELPF